MAIASDVDDSSTGRSGKSVENEDTNMLADSSGSKQIDCTVHHYYEKLKDFAFDMPGGWTDATISIFIDTFKLYKDDFSRPHSDDLKIWQKIVKRCVERSKNFKVFTVNSVMELAGSLKSHVLRNEYRKDDENFKMLCNDVSDIMPYFPNTTCDSVSQNLRLRRRNPPQEVTTFAKVTEPPPKAANIDNLILKYCKELNIKNDVNCCNSNWNTMSVRILKEHGIKVDVKKHLGNMKRKIHKELKTVTDPAKKKTFFYKAIGPFWQYFNVMPPKTIKIDDFDKDFNEAEFASQEVSAENCPDKQNSRTEVEQTTPPISENPRVNGGSPAKKNKPGSSNVQTLPKVVKFVSDDCFSSESDKPVIKKTISSKNGPSTVGSPSTSEASNENGESNIVEKLGEVAKLPPSKKKVVVEVQTEPSKTFKGKTMMSIDDEASLQRSSRAIKRPASTATRNSENTGVYTNAKNARISEKAASLTKNIQNQIELSPLKTGSSPVPALCQNAAKRVVQKRQVGVTSRSKKINTEPVVQTNMKMNSVNFDGEPQPEARSAAPITANCLDRLKSKNIVTPINVKVNELLQQEASTSASCTEQRYISRPEISVQQWPPSTSVSQEFNRLEQMEDSTVKIIEGFKEKVIESGQSVMQLIPKQQIAISPIGVLTNNTTGSEIDLTGQPLPVSKPPAWFDTFFKEFKKLEMWKMHQILRMQTDLVDMENRKLAVLDKILELLNEKKS